MINYILFDLDNTLYPASCGIGREMIRRMNIFTADFLGTTVEEAAVMRRDRDSSRFDSTLDWLQKEYSLKNSEDFFKFVHPEDLENYFPVNEKLVSMLEKMPVPVSVLTNSSIEHAKNVTDYLGITQFFENIFDLKYNNFKGKPNKAAYENALSAIGKKAENVLFIDDIPSYLKTFKEMGGHVLLVDETSDYSIPDISAIQEITELEEYLKMQGLF